MLKNLHRAALAAVLALTAATTPALADTTQRVNQLAEAQADRLVSTFKHLHANPELGFQETETAKLVSKRLKKLGYQVHTGIGGTGVAAVLKNGDGPVVMFRSDMDGLPVKEDTGLDYASRKQVTLDDGGKAHVAHACGHDAHVSWLLGIAEVMRETRDAWSGTLVLIAQPAEELLEGAQAMVDDDLYDRVPKPELLISAHVFPVWPAGTVAVRAGRRMAGSDQLDVTLHGVGGHGSSPHNTIDPVVMFRSDMDGLPVKEDTGLDYASRKQVTLDDGSKTHVAHACGHDAHVSWLLGIAEVMRETRDAWAGTLVLIAQPAEELLEGAQAMVDDDLYDRVPKPELLISAHVFPVWPAGTVAVRAGRRMAGSDQLDVTLHGVGGHGSAPHNTIDPVVMGARSVMAYQTIVSRNVDPQKPAVLTVGASQIGEANNVIPDNGTLKLNLRWYEKPVRQQMLDAIKRETNGIARAAGVADDKMPEYTLKGYSEPVYNDEALAEQAQQTLAAGLGKEALMPGFPPVMGSEDFPMLVAGIEDARTLFMEVGGGAPDVMKKYMATGELPPMNHNPKFEIINPRLAITTAVKANSLLLLDALSAE